MPFSSYVPDELGTAVITPEGPFEAGSHVPLTFTYTAGRFGIDDTGALKISWRSASDSGKPQFKDPKAPNYTTAFATNGAKLEVEYNRNNIRPWVNTIFVRVMSGFLRAGEQIILKIGDPSGGSPGYRLQTCCDVDFQFRTFVDAFSTYDFVALPQSPTLHLVAGPPARWKAHLPTLRRTGQSFRLAIVPEDRWGNPTDRADQEIVLVPNRAVTGLPERVRLRPGDGPLVIDGLSLEAPGDLAIGLETPAGAVLGRSNPLRVVDEAPVLHFWGDLHGQSNETVGTNTVEQYYAFARDRAFIDMVCHQGNDFQIDDALWAEINRLAAEYDEPGSFVALPGYEWSGNTGMGGDHNVLYATEGRPIYRSSKVLLDESQAKDPVCFRVDDLFKALEGEDVVVLAHVGGRYADVGVAHDGRIEQAVEVHSCWGTFRVDPARRHGAGLPRRRRLPQRRPQGPAGCRLSGRLAVRRHRRPDLLPHAEPRPAEPHGGAAPPPPLRHHRHTPLSRRRGALRRAGRALPDRPRPWPGRERAGRCGRDGRHRPGDGTAVELAVDVIGSAPIERVTVFNGPSPSPSTARTQPATSAAASG
ncbi:MAG: DUF3604 domain-containing protein [Geminicoccaceae bacterium]